MRQTVVKFTMPELPDLEVFSRNLHRWLAGKKLETIKVISSSTINVSVSSLKKTIEGKKLKEVYREGKELRFVFQSQSILGIHLMLHGKLYWFNGKNTTRHTLIESNPEYPGIMIHSIAHDLELKKMILSIKKIMIMIIIIRLPGM